MSSSDDNPWLAVPAAYRNLPAHTPVPLIGLDFALDTMRGPEIVVTPVVIRNARVGEYGVGFDFEISKGSAGSKWARAGFSARSYGPDHISIESSIQANTFLGSVDVEELPQIQSNVTSERGVDYGLRVIVRLSARIYVMEEERAAAIASFNERASALLGKLQATLAHAAAHLPAPTDGALAPEPQSPSDDAPTRPRKARP